MDSCGPRHTDRYRGQAPDAPGGRPPRASRRPVSASSESDLACERAAVYCCTRPRDPANSADLAAAPLPVLARYAPCGPGQLAVDHRRFGPRLGYMRDRLCRVACAGHGWRTSREAASGDPRPSVKPSGSAAPLPVLGRWRSLRSGMEAGSAVPHLLARHVRWLTGGGSCGSFVRQCQGNGCGSASWVVLTLGRIWGGHPPMAATSHRYSPPLRVRCA